MPAIVTIDTPVALEAQDLLPETWVALAAASSFGPDALARRHDAVIQRTFGISVDQIDQVGLDYRLIDYLGKLLALTLLDPGIEYWSRQVISRTVGERESSVYKDRAEDLRLLKKEWTGQLADMYVDIRDMLPVIPGRAGDMPRVALPGALTNTVDNPRDQGEQVAYTTANPYDIEPLSGPPEGTTTTTGA